MVVNKPYSELIKDGYIIREFLSSDSSEFVWHRDKEDRIIEPMEENDWKIQFDNELPMNIDGKIFIENNKYHRIIAGDKPSIKIKIIKFNN